MMNDSSGGEGAGGGGSRAGLHLWRTADLDVTHTHIGLPAGLGWVEWQQLGDPILAASAGSLWWLGDWLIYAEDNLATRDDEGGVVSRDRARIHAAAADARGVELKTVEQAIRIARRFPPASRLAGCSWTHHQTVAGLDDWVLAASLLADAAEFDWSREQLRQAMRDAVKEASAVDVESEEVKPPSRPVSVSLDAGSLCAAAPQLRAIVAHWRASGTVEDAGLAALEAIVEALLDAAKKAEKGRRAA